MTHPPLSTSLVKLGHQVTIQFNQNPYLLKFFCTKLPSQPRINIDLTNLSVHLALQVCIVNFLKGAEKAPQTTRRLREFSSTPAYPAAWKFGSSSSRIEFARFVCIWRNVDIRTRDSYLQQQPIGIIDKKRQDARAKLIVFFRSDCDICVGCGWSGFSHKFLIRWVFLKNFVLKGHTER